MSGTQALKSPFKWSILMAEPLYLKGGSGLKVTRYNSLKKVTLFFLIAKN
jgi:hypothetical protein